VVIVTYSPGPLLDTCLTSLAAACSEPYDVVLADNGSTDGYPERFASRPSVTLLKTGRNLGYGRAANLGAALAPPTPWLLVCNPDVEFDAGSVDALLAAAERWPEAGSLGPAIVEPDGSLYPSARAVPTLGLGAGHAIAGLFWRDNPWTRRYTGRGDNPAERPVGWLSGACLLLRRDAWDSVGGFDPRYFMYFEDVDLGDRLGRAGWSNVYVPSARVRHIGGATTARDSARMLAAHHQSAARFAVDRYPRAVARLVELGLDLRLRLLARRGEGADE
jgi:N-acetylglucosaminyl-diphospho-decaprenol L-rhamnosyltransferase